MKGEEYGNGTPAVVVPTITIPHAVACLRALGRRGIHTIGVCEQVTPGFHSRYCDESLIVPAPATDINAYKNALLSLAEQPRVRTIVPMREEESYVLAKYRAEFGDHLKPVWPSFETIQTVQDRCQLVAAADAAGVTAPPTELLTEVDNWDRNRVVKARYSILTTDYVNDVPQSGFVSPNAVYFLEPDNEPDVGAIRAEMGHDPIAQEYIPGEEFALWALYDRGEPVVTCQKHQIRAEHYYGGTSIYRRTTYDPALEAAGRALLDHLEWHGLAAVQFKRDTRTGEFTLMEINPRAWASMSCPVQAGVNFPYYYWCIATDTPLEASTIAACRLGVGTHHLAGEIKYLHSAVRDDHPFVDPPSLSRALLAVGGSLLTQPHYELLSVDDPRPFIAELGGWMRNRNLLGWIQNHVPIIPRKGNS